MTHDEWIRAYVERRRGVVVGLCMSAAREMSEAFSELRFVRGFAELATGGRCEHAWCETEAGVPIDPTASQYDHLGGVVAYHEWKPGDFVKVGRCMNCGEDIYERPKTLDGQRKMICSPECAKEFAEEMA